MNTPRRRSEQEVKQIDKVNAVGKRHASVVTGTLEAAESRPQHLQPAKSSFSNRVAHPQRSRVEPENMANLQNQPALLCEFREHLCLARDQCDRFFHEHILSISSNSRHVSKCAGAGVTTTAASIFGKSE